MKNLLQGLFTENLSYKAVSLFIALILWVTILGRRDFVYTKTLDVEVRPAVGLKVVAQTADRIKVRVSGSRAALRKFMDSAGTHALLLDVSERGEGVIDVDIPSSKVGVPMGVRVLSVRPNMIRVEIIRDQSGDPPPASDLPADER